MAYSKIQMPGNGTNGPFTVSFALGYLSQSEVTCRVNEEVDGLGDPVYRTITWLDTELVNISGTAPTASDTIVFERTVSKTVLKHDFNDGAPITEKNLDESHKQALMLVHEALDGRFGALQADLDAGNNRIINVLDPVDDQDAATKAYVDLQVFAAGAVPAPTAPDVNKVLTATGVGTYSWASPVVIPDATESVAGIVELATDAEVTTGTSNTLVMSVLKAVTAFARKAVANTFTAAQNISGPAGIALTLRTPAAAPVDLYLNRETAAPGAVNDAASRILFQGPNDASATSIFGYIEQRAAAVAAGAQSGKLRIIQYIANVGTQVAEFANGVVLGAATGSFKGTGTLNATGLYVQGVGAAGPSACFAHETTGAGGATVATTWTVVPNNVTKWNDIPGASIAANQITLPAGEYIIRATHRFESGAETCLRLWNVTDGSLIQNGIWADVTTGGYGHVADVGPAKLVIAGSKVIRVEYYQLSADADGLGSDIGPVGHTHHFGNIFIEKVA